MMTLRLLTQIGSLNVIFLIENLVPLFRGREHRLRHALPNLGMGIINAFVVAILFSAITIHIIEWTRSHHWGLRAYWAMPPALKIGRAHV